MLIRAATFPIMSLWYKDKIDDVPLKALNLWNLPKDDNDFSTYEISSDEKNDETDWLCLCMLVKNFNKYKDGVEFFFLKDDFVNNYVYIEKDEKKFLGCLHVNIKEVNYLMYSKLINYTFNNKINYISYRDIEIKKIFKKYDKNSLDKLLSELDDSTKKKFKKQIKTRFFKDEILDIFD